MKTQFTSSARALLFTAVFAAGAVPLASQAQNGHHPRAQHAAQCESCGFVVSNRTYEAEPQRASGVGAVGGAVLGGLLGNQVGSGRGRTLATVAGAVGGAYGGNRVERNMHRQTVTEVRVKMNDGSYRTVTEQGGARYPNGTKVRVEGDHLVRR
jgi:outer membrane lipoprotein SlyB